MDAARLLSDVRQVLATEGRAVLALAEGLDGQAAAVVAAAEAILTRTGAGRTGRLVVTGVGKAGLVGRKLSATFASTGTPSLFLHPTEARHGDLGMVADGDVVLALSNSGTTEEVLAIMPSLVQAGATVIALVGNPASPLARHAAVVLSIGRATEACPLGLAPSTSTTAMLALGDALALGVLTARGFTTGDYARFHPGGNLGRKLMTAAEAMRSGARVATVAPSASVADTLKSITSARSGSACLVDPAGKLLGIFTDGDLRRVLIASADPAATLRGPVGDCATRGCLRVRGDELVAKALHLCAERKIDELPVVDADDRLIGLLDVQDLIDRGFQAAG